MLIAFWGLLSIFTDTLVNNNLMIHIPAGVYKAYLNPSLNWNYNTSTEPGLKGRSVFTPRGKVLGGSSSINSMVYPMLK